MIKVILPTGATQEVDIEDTIEGKDLLLLLQQQNANNAALAGAEIDKDEVDEAGVRIVSLKRSGKTKG
jgi:hypothetical protein